MAARAARAPDRATFLGWQSLHASRLGGFFWTAMNLNAVVKGHARRSRVLFIYAADLTLCEEIACAEPPTIIQ